MTQQNQNKLIARPPVVVVLGHVDHGKSSILQAIKNFKILEKESGGITQHIGAYEIEHQDRKITFIDTPGHEAFSQIRSRGAKVADIAVLVVAAEEGVKPQTKEAISIIKKAEIPFIVAINKIDKPEADPEKVKRELSKEDILVESMGGEVPLVEVSAKTGKGISDLLEIVLLVADMEGLEADISKPARGVIIEAYLDNLRGPTATLLLSEGRLEPGQIIGTFSAFGKIKILEDFQGNSIPEALPSQPVIVLGLEEVPRVGEEFKFFSNLEEARTNLQALKKEAQEVPLSVDSKESEKRVLNIIIIADVLGSLEAIEQVLGNIPQEKVALRILKAQVGEITESDVKAAKRARAKILGFRVKANSVAKSLADRENIKIMQFEVIYELVEGVRNYMERMVKSEMAREDLGKMKILAIFRTEKNRQILGGRIIEGEIRKGTQIEVMRGEEIIGKGKLINLQRNKKEAERILKGDECGILYEGSVKAEEGDVLLIYTEGRIKGEL